MAAKRGKTPFVPEPMKVSNNIIKICRANIDAPFKKIFRRIINYFLKIFYQLDYLGEGAQLSFGSRIPRGSKIGRYSYIGAGFQSPSPISVGDLCMISTDVKIIGNDHRFDDPTIPTRLNFNWTHKITELEPDVWIGHHVIILAGIKIGTGAVVASGSLVTKNIPPNSIYGGVPARLMRNRFSSGEYKIYENAIRY